MALIKSFSLVLLPKDGAGRRVLKPRVHPPECPQPETQASAGAPESSQDRDTTNEATRHNHLQSDP